MKYGLLKKNSGVGNELDHFRRRLSTVFDDFFNMETTGLWDQEWVPAVDVEEDESAYYVRAEMPGIDEKDMSVTVAGSVLTIQGEKNQDKKTSADRTTLLCERCYGSFFRSLTLPGEIAGDTISAKYANGLLSVTVPKAKAERPKKIDISVK